MLGSYLSSWQHVNSHLCTLQLPASDCRVGSGRDRFFECINQKSVSIFLKFFRGSSTPRPQWHAGNLWHLLRVKQDMRQLSTALQSSLFNEVDELLHWIRPSDANRLTIAPKPQQLLVFHHYTQESFCSRASAAVGSNRKHSTIRELVWIELSVDETKKLSSPLKWHVL
jgi:hypothetical protein